MLPIVTDIYNHIVSKAAVYQLIVERTHKVSSEEAVKIITGEIEIFQSRLNAYLSDSKNSSATITIAQGANIFLDVMEMGLSFSRIANHVYVSRMKGTGTAIGYKVTKEGAIFLAQIAGAIDHCSEAVIVWKGEDFSISPTPDGHEVANHVQRYDNKPAFNIDNMLVGYVYVVYPNGDRELSRISGTRMKELMAKSASPGMYNDESFIETKIIKHALRSVRMRPFIAQSQIADDEGSLPPAIEQTAHHTVPVPVHQAAVPQQPGIQTYEAPPPQQPLFMPPEHPIQQPLQPLQQLEQQILQQQQQILQQPQPITQPGQTFGSPLPPQPNYLGQTPRPDPF